MVKALIFDCFGVIYPDTLSIVERAFLHKNHDKRDAIRTLRQKCDIGQVDRDTFWNGVAEIMNISRGDLDAELNKVRGADWELLDYIKQLRAKGYKTALLSNVGPGFLEKIFAGKKSLDYFDILVPSYELGYLKPSPEAYRITAEHLSVKPAACVMIDDSDNNCKGAEDVGMQSVRYTSLETCKTRLARLLTNNK